MYKRQLLLLAGCGKKNTDGMSVSDTEAAEMEALDFEASDYVKLGDYKNCLLYTSRCV